MQIVVAAGDTRLLARSTVNSAPIPLFNSIRVSCVAAAALRSLLRRRFSQRWSFVPSLRKHFDDICARA
ncbi:hypothetical protein L596_015856 [Steinernema carpocapsae]|uniref:Uncharacterized protein n=1 Tax=Steinernema carpocapsae TaxID=34508 RepID=A0A4U5NHG1_STECR|nr:hypothetical protein L596_015856 [Steinernema carpocapsae]